MPLVGFGQQRGDVDQLAGLDLGVGAHARCAAVGCWGGHHGRVPSRVSASAARTSPALATAQMSSNATASRLGSIAGETAGLAGWLAFDMEDRRAAAAYFRAGIEAAQEANDRALGAYLVGSSCVQPAYRERPQARLRRLQDRRLVSRPSMPTLRLVPG